jgi:hypothetical protein
MFNPNDYPATQAQAAYEARRDEQDAAERAELLAQEEEEERAREREFRETMFCETTCYDDLVHTARCRSLNEPPVAAALNGWVKAVTRRAA